VIIKARIMTQPIRHQVKRRFDELNIEIPFPQQTVYFGTDKQGEAPLAHLLLERRPQAS